jgi:hypothetical protein
MSKLTVKTYIEVLEDGVVTRREIIPEADRLVVMRFKAAGGGTDATLAAIGGFDKLAVVDYAVTCAQGLSKITEGRSDAPQLWEMYEGILNKHLAELANRETEKSKDDIRRMLKAKGASDAAIDVILEAVEQAAEETFKRMEAQRNGGKDK